MFENIEHKKSKNYCWTIYDFSEVAFSSEVVKLYHLTDRI